MSKRKAEFYIGGHTVIRLSAHPRDWRREPEAKPSDVQALARVTIVKWQIWKETKKKKKKK